MPEIFWDKNKRASIKKTVLENIQALFESNDKYFLAKSS